MARHSKVENRGLLQPDEFDIDELDYLEPETGHARNSSKDWSKRPRSRRRCSRPVFFCWATLLVIVVLGVGIALNQGSRLKIPKLPDKLTPPWKSKPSDTEKPNAPDTGLPGDLKTNTTDNSVIEEFEARPRPGLDDDIKARPTPGNGEVQHVSTTAESEEDPVTAAATEASASPAEPTKSGKSSHAAEDDSTQSTPSKWTKPKGFKIIGLVFYGRPDTVAILDCYLRKNLVRNGGWMDEIHFVLNTDKKDDLKWLDGIVKDVKEYKKVEVKTKEQKDGYNAAWATCNEEDMYIKIDDDIVFFDDEAIPNLVFSLTKHPNALNVVSNLINSPGTGWLHYRLGAIHAYLPEMYRTKDSLNDQEGYGPDAWRASQLPLWSGNESEMEFTVAGVGMGKDDGYIRLAEDEKGAPPFKGHRWLPLPEGDKNVWRTPSAQSEYAPNGKDWASWSLGAQAHYSFLQNLENGTLNLYHMGGGLDTRHEGIWNMAYERMNINFMAIWGKDVKANLPFDSFDDEQALSIQVPLKLRRPLLVNTHAIASHFHFRSQLEMYDTDLLDRYRAYANEKVCTKENQIKPDSNSG